MMVGAQQSTKTEVKSNHDPEAAELISSDIENFWRAYGQMNPADWN